MGDGLERYTSYGRGGAGNLRRPSTRTEAMDQLTALADTVTPQRRRSSHWSMSSTSNGERRTSVWKSIFRRSSSVEEPEPEAQKVDE